MRPKIIEVSIVGDLRRRDIWMVGEKKAGCLTTYSNTAGVGKQKTTRWILEYEESCITPTP